MDHRLMEVIYGEAVVVDWTDELTTAWEIEIDVEAFISFRERDAFDRPGAFQARELGVKRDSIGEDMAASLKVEMGTVNIINQPALLATHSKQRGTSYINNKIIFHKINRD